MSVSTFNTPIPIAVVLDLYVADVHVVASERIDSTVEVRPSDPGRSADIKAADNTRVEYDETTGTLSIVTPKPLHRFVNFSKRPESIDVVLHLPLDSAVRGEVELGDYRTEGALGAVALKTGFGALRIGDSASLDLRTSLGEIFVDSVAGPAKVHSGSGEIRLGAVDGTAEVSTSNGTIRIGVVTGAANIKVGNGAVHVDRALSDITAANSNGEVRIGEVVRGKVSATTKNGRVDVGIREGSAAWLELNTKVGRVYNELSASEAPDEGEPVDKVEVRASTKLGDVLVRRTPRLEAQP
jgi:hypothetical protein